MIDLNRLSAAISTWRDRNFPTPVSSHWEPLIGMQEELGELAHYNLKARQGIRPPAPGSEEDAIGDILIFLLHYCAMRRINVEQTLVETWRRVSLRDWTKFPKNGLPETPNVDV